MPELKSYVIVDAIETMEFERQCNQMHEQGFDPVTNIAIIPLNGKNRFLQGWRRTPTNSDAVRIVKNLHRFINQPQDQQPHTWNGLMQEVCRIIRDEPGK